MQEAIKGRKNIQKYFEELRLVDMNNPYSNAQILCHAPGINGLEHSKRILDEGLYISAEAKIKNGISIESNAEVSSGICSTNKVVNGLDNSFNLSNLSISQTKISNVGMCVVSAIPQEIEGIYLGKIRQIRDNRTKGCVLDNFGMDKIPPEFIVGVYYVNTEKGNAVLKPNNKFFALNEENKKIAGDYVKNLLNNDNFIGEFINEKTRKDSALYSFIQESNNKDSEKRKIYEKRVQEFKNMFPYLAGKIEEIDTDIKLENLKNEFEGLGL